ncbi:uncharacterized protein [Equus przewalskii]|uniref:Uncharacterized protein isoform X5 n=1 Tax=Equus przewalskii TaxID=9798 RepID=A0ABM4QE55_EQUPR
MSCSYPRWWLAGWKVSAGSQAALPVGESQAREVSSHSLPVWRSMRMPLCLCSVCGRVFPLWASAGRPLLPAAAATGRCLCRAPPRRWSRSWRMGPTAPSPWTGGKCSRPPTLPGAGLRGEMRLASLRVIWPGSHLGGPAYLPQVQLQHLGPRRAELEAPVPELLPALEPEQGPAPGPEAAPAVVPPSAPELEAASPPSSLTSSSLTSIGLSRAGASAISFSPSASF